MIKKNYGILKIVFYLCFYYTVSYVFKSDKYNGRLIVKEKWQRCVNDVLRKYFFNNINVTGEMKKSDDNKIDLLVANHISTIDFLIIIVILCQFNIPNYYFVFKDSLIKIPIFGSLISDDIRITRNWENDEGLISDQLKNIKNGTIIIYPEGTRYDNKKHKQSMEYCIQNKLPIYNYTLAPKAKGLHCMFSILSNSNRLGKIYDLTLIMPKYINKTMYLTKLLGASEIGDLEVYIRELLFNKYDLNYESFKKTLYKHWLSKNILIDLYLKNLSKLT
jgi:1-acyl-sn-glycerol-3-phosphate acyltransferase